MTVLRSRVVLPTKTTLKSSKTRISGIEPVTPTQTHEPSSILLPLPTTTNPSSSSPNKPTNSCPGNSGLGSDAVPVSGAIRRRSLRLASRVDSAEVANESLIFDRRREGEEGNYSVLGTYLVEEDKAGIDISKDIGAPSMSVELSGKMSLDSIGDTVRVLEVKDGKVLFVEDSDAEGGGNGPGLRQEVVQVNQVDVKSLDEDRSNFTGGGSRSKFKNAKGKRKMGIDVRLGTEYAGDEGSKRFLNLRSGKLISKIGTDTVVDKNEDLRKDDEYSRNNISAKRIRGIEIEGKGKGKLGKDDLLSNGEAVRLDVEFGIDNLMGDVVGVDSFQSISVRKMEEEDKREFGCSGELGVVTENLEQGPSGAENSTLKRRRFSREEKGKGALADTGGSLSTVSHAVELDLISKINGSGDYANSPANHLSINVALQDERQFRSTSTREGVSRRNEYMERFRDIARENASRFAHFSREEEAENDNHLSPDAEVDREIEDWPGPFSTAMKIIKDRTMKSSKKVCSSSGKSVPKPITWVPKKGQSNIPAKLLVPSLQELCIMILAKHVDAIASLESVPDALRNKLSQLLCDSRRMNNHFFELLVRGSPTEICLRDCSWLTEEQFVKSFQGCDTSNLAVLQLDQCGRCMPDYVLLDTIAQSSYRFPGLTNLSLTGACRLSDLGLGALVSSSPVLRSINLSQCSLLTYASINILSDSLGSLLRELYLDDCQSIDAMLSLPALKKLEHLEIFSVAGLETVCDQFIREYIIACGHNIKELVLRDCVKLTDSSLKVIAEQCSKLCALNLMNLCKLTDSSIGYLANGCRAIHTLTLRRNAFSDEAIAAFLETSGEFLSDLSLNNVKKVGRNTAISLSRHARRLHSLDLSWCRSLSDDAVGLIVDSCSSLMVLKLFGCTQITDVFLNGHSNSRIQILGLKMTSLLKCVKVPHPQEGPLHYSSLSCSI
ncbi:F-box/LRR-repeat protein 13 [Quillaja saponaria]|uniref:F-box/LRR-repeat protein 13 n=1 Tax=Quillaja saponaria TaxID=32244 RepID=A0AAD7PHM7_QUISA|nr:F-box/LRR-repeat protein 13 [Quillaja saponaria]